MQYMTYYACPVVNPQILLLGRQLGTAWPIVP